MDIKLTATLTAYSKGVLPTKLSQLTDDLNLVSDLNDDQSNGKFYVRVKYPQAEKGQWVEIQGDSFGDEIELLPNSGLILDKQGNTAAIAIDQFILSKEQFEHISNLSQNTTYYVYDRQPQLYVNGGTAFSQGGNEFVDLNQYGIEINGGAASSTYELMLLPINAKGVYDG